MLDVVLLKNNIIYLISVTYYTDRNVKYETY